MKNRGRKTRYRFWVVLIIVCVMVTEKITFTLAEKSAQNLQMRTPSIESLDITTKDNANPEYTVVCELTGSWENCVQLQVKVQNTGIVPIDNWALSFNMNGNIIDIWGAYVCSNVNDYWIVRHLDYNGRISAGGEVEFSMIVEKGREYLQPAQFNMTIERCNVNPSGFSVEVEYYNQWDNGCCGKITICNNTENAICGWNISFPKIDKSVSLWDFERTEYSPECSYRGMSYNCEIPAGGVVCTGFFASHERTIDISDAILSEARVFDIADGLIEKDVLKDYVPVSDQYQVIPIYSPEQDVAAYLVAYSENGEVCSYAIVSNQVNSAEAYLMEFGANLPSFCPTIDLLEREELSLCYLGGYSYCLRKEDMFYSYDGEKLVRIGLESNIEAIGKAGKSDVQYYEYKKTLDRSAIYAKEVGYQRITESKLRTDSNYALNAKLKRMSDIKSAYYNKYKKTITSHCGPSVILNTLLLFKSMGFSKITVNPGNDSSIATTFDDILDDCGLFFGQSWGLPCWKCKSSTISMLKKYGYTGAGGNTYAQASWSRIKTCIENTYKSRNVSAGTVYSTPTVAVVYLDDSQIYDDHFVIGTGYITFAHASGWQSRYIQIFDQWDTTLKYVNYSLGIDFISVLEIYAESGLNQPPIPTPAPRS